MTASPEPHYQRLKSHILARIAQGELRPGDRVPSEHELVAAFGISWMTANRALRELTADGRLVRIAGVGSFVAPPRPQGAVLQIRSIGDEIAARGHRHAARVLALDNVPASPDLADRFGIAPGEPLFHSRLVHLEEQLPLQLEERWVLPAIAPDYLAQDFPRTTPSRHLLEMAPIQEAEHEVEAVMPDPATRRLLEMEAMEPCLLLHRRTWVAQIGGAPAGAAQTGGVPAGMAPEGRQVGSFARLWHPGSRYTLGGRFTP